MRILACYPARCMPRTVDPAVLRTSERGLTGSEEAFFGYARELARWGHVVTLVCNTDPGSWEGVRFKPLVEPDDFEAADAFVSWMSPAFPRSEPQDTRFRLYVEQCSDFGNTPWDWRPHVDCFGCLSRSHAEHLSRERPFDRASCRIVPNGVDLEEFRPLYKIRGRCVWASSHDRGLHHLLGAWPEIKRRAPHASLRVLYDPSGMRAFSQMPPQPDGWPEELRRRSVYQLEALDRLRRLDVELVGTVSREQMREELGRAEVLAYPCDPVRYTETFGSTVLEAMAAGCVPVLRLADAFGELWGERCPAVSAGPGWHPAYVDLLAGVLNSPELLRRDAAECRLAASRYSWERLGAMMDACLRSRGEQGFDHW